MKKFVLTMVGLAAVFLALGLCLKNVESERRIERRNGDGLGGGVHYDIPHCQDTVQEDAQGCPCLCLKMGYSSYANMTNAIAHGYTNSIYEIYRDELVRPAASTGGVVKLVTILNFEERLMEKINGK